MATLTVLPRVCSRREVSVVPFTSHVMVGRGEPVATHCMSVVVPGRMVTFVGETWEGGRGEGSEGVREGGR